MFDHANGDASSTKESIFSQICISLHNKQKSHYFNQVIVTKRTLMEV